MKPAISSGVFVLKDADTLVPMEGAHFASEDDLQGLLAKLPALLSGDQIKSDRSMEMVACKKGEVGS